LVPIDSGNWRLAMEVSVTADQLPFAADHQPVALVIMAKAFIADGDLDWEPLAFELGDGAIVGVLGLAHDAATSYVFNLAVDQSHQRTGVGTAAVAELIERVRARSGTCLSLTVHPENEGGRNLYRKAGFSPTGATKHGEPVWELRL
jgi:ribosomal protein S18 acetylase RimI-like enzyme